MKYVSIRLNRDVPLEDWMEKGGDFRTDLIDTTDSREMVATILSQLSSKEVTYIFFRLVGATREEASNILGYKPLKNRSSSYYELGNRTKRKVGEVMEKIRKGEDLISIRSRKSPKNIRN